MNSNFFTTAIVYSQLVPEYKRKQISFDRQYNSESKEKSIVPEQV